MKTKVVGITGGIGAGKSTVCELISKMGYPVFNSDLEARKILNQASVIEELTLLFGNQIIDNQVVGDQTINRSALAKIVFQDKTKLEQLNQLIHPKVAKVFQNWIGEQKSALVFKESALLFETNDQSVDYSCLVFADQDLRIQRVMERDRCTKAEVLNRIGKQMPEDQKRAKADFVITNSSTLLIPQVLQFLEALHKL
ncbi:MAG: dephospho-CoA kinase [Flavobacteriales bacterium]